MSTDIGKNIVDQLERSGVDLELSSADNDAVVVSSDSIRDLTEEETNAINVNLTEVVAEVASKITTSNEGVAPKAVYRVKSISATAGIPILQSEKG
ncbi:hypothetical protein CL614_07850, partial [archaeon]|nr:hypothetical protein [archaeon]